MYHFQNSAPEDMCWLHQHSSTRPILDSDFDRRGWPNEQLQTEWRTPPRAPLPFNQRFGVCASVQPASLGWCGAIYTDQPETPSGLNSHTDAGIMASLAPCHPVSTPNRAPHFQYRTCLPQWQSLNQGPYRNSSQQSSHVHADHSMPCSSQGKAAQNSSHDSRTALMLVLGA